MCRVEARAGRRTSGSPSRMLRWFTSVVGLVVLAGVATAAPAPAAENPYQRGPDPSRESVAASRGTFATASMPVPEFRKGVIYHPTDTSQDTFGAIAFIPGYNGSWAALEWAGPWLASFGFVVMGFEAVNPGDGDTARGTQLLSALDLSDAAQCGARPDRLQPPGGDRSLDGWWRSHVRGGTAAVTQDRCRPGAGDLQHEHDHRAGAVHVDGRAERHDGHAVVHINAVVWNSGGTGADALWTLEPVSTGGFRLDNQNAGSEYLYATSAGEAKWNTGATDAATVWAFEPK